MFLKNICAEVWFSFVFFVCK